LDKDASRCAHELPCFAAEQGFSCVWTPIYVRCATLIPGPRKRLPIPPLKQSYLKNFCDDIEHMHGRVDTPHISHHFNGGEREEEKASRPRCWWTTQSPRFGFDRLDLSDSGQAHRCRWSLSGHWYLSTFVRLHYEGASPLTSHHSQYSRSEMSFDPFQSIPKIPRRWQIR